MEPTKPPDPLATKLNKEREERERVAKLEKDLDRMTTWTLTWFILCICVFLLMCFLWHEDVAAITLEAKIDKEAERRYFDTYRRRHNGSFPPEYYPPAPPRKDDPVPIPVNTPKSEQALKDANTRLANAKAEFIEQLTKLLPVITELLTDAVKEAKEGRRSR